MTEEQRKNAEALALRVLASIRLTGDLEEDRQEAVRGLRANMGARRPLLRDEPQMTAPIHRPTDMHPTKEEIEQC